MAELDFGEVRTAAATVGDPFTDMLIRNEVLLASFYIQVFSALLFAPTCLALVFKYRAHMERIGITMLLVCVVCFLFDLVTALVILILHY